MKRAIATAATVAIYGTALAAWALFWYGVASFLWFVFTLK